MNNLAPELELTFCNVDGLFYLYHNGEQIHTQQTQPTESEIIESLQSDNWRFVFSEMEAGKTVRVSDRIYYDMLGSVPPIRQRATSFFVGEAYSGDLHHFFFIKDGKRYGQLKSIHNQ